MRRFAFRLALAALALTGSDAVAQQGKTNNRPAAPAVAKAAAPRPAPVARPTTPAAPRPTPVARPTTPAAPRPASVVTPAIPRPTPQPRPTVSPTGPSKPVVRPTNPGGQTSNKPTVIRPNPRPSGTKPVPTKTLGGQTGNKPTTVKVLPNKGGSSGNKPTIKPPSGTKPTKPEPKITHDTLVVKPIPPKPTPTPDSGGKPKDLLIVVRPTILPLVDPTPVIQPIIQPVAPSVFYPPTVIQPTVAPPTVIQPAVAPPAGGSDIDAEPAADFGLKVTFLADNGAAAQAGIGVGDILLTVGGVRVQSFDEMVAALANAGGSVEVVIAKADTCEMVTLLVVLIDGKLGVAVDAIAIQMPEEPAAEYGLKVNYLADSGAAAQAGVGVGDILLTIGGERVQSFDEMAAAAAKAGGPVEVVLARADTFEMVKLVVVPAAGKLGVAVDPVEIQMGQ
jgi:hypothetical protein